MQNNFLDVVILKSEMTALLRHFLLINVILSPILDSVATDSIQGM